MSLPAWLTSACLLIHIAHSACAAQLQFDAGTLLDRSLTRDLRLSEDGNAIELARGVLIEDDGPAAGYSYKPNEERLSAGVRIRKDILIADPRVRRSTLLVAPGGTLSVEINGRKAPLRGGEQASGRWRAFDLPGEALRAGRNDVILHGQGSVWIARDDEYAAGSRERTKHPNRSAKSRDDGRTWDYERLGPEGTIDGEYCVRLFLDQHRPSGSVVLPVIDLGNLQGRAVADAVASIGTVRVAVDAEFGEGGSISTKARFGPTFAPGGSWGAWRELGSTGGAVEKPEGRYVQIAVDLATANPLVTPKLKGVTVEASPQVSADWARQVRMMGSHNEQIVRSSIPFVYETFDHPRLRLLRERYRLDDVVKGAQDELETITRLAQWSARQWKKGHLGESYPAWDAIEILKPHADGTPVGGFCQQYNVVFLQACECFGLAGRAVSIGPGGLIDRPRRGGHEVVEIWSNDYRKWIYMDGQFAWYAVDETTGVPLSLLELRARQLDTLAGRPVPPMRIVKPGDVPARTREDWNGLDTGLPFGELRLIPRSNFLAERSPLPLNQGMRGWFWTGHCVWTDDVLPAALIYGNRISSRANWEWTLNQAQYALEATATPGEVHVHLDTQTPGFTTYLADVDGSGERQVATGFVWTLRKGTNRLEVRPGNVAGRKGIKSWVVLEY